MRDYQAWHKQDDHPQSPLSQRLRVVQRRLAELLSDAPPGPIRIISKCAGRGHDLLGVLPTHLRRDDVSSVLVEIDPVNAALAREGAARAGLSNFHVIEADAALTDVYAPYRSGVRNLPQHFRRRPRAHDTKCLHARPSRHGGHLDPPPAGARPHAVHPRLVPRERL